MEKRLKLNLETIRSLEESSMLEVQGGAVRAVPVDCPPVSWHSCFCTTSVSPCCA